MRSSKRSLVRTMLAVLAAVSVLTGPPAVAGRFSDEVSRFDGDAGASVGAVEALLSPASTVTSALPADPQQALIDATAELSADVGFPQDPSSQLLLARLPDEIAGRLANVLDVMITCNEITQAHYAAIEPNLEQVAWDGGGLETSQFADVRRCASTLWTATTELELVLGNGAPGSTRAAACRNLVPVNIWPVLRFEPLCTSHTYANDYLLTVDLGGDDVYSNNQGSNMVDLNYAPATSRVSGPRGWGPSQGCQQAIAGLRKTDCVPAVAVLLDLAGRDTYGVMQSPDLDQRCTPTSSLLIRRMVTGGVGFLGVGILRDVGVYGDRYTSKTVSLGAGHIFGVGVLSDAGGGDSYLSIRNSQGFALVGGVGILRDETGNDSYDYYMPPIKTPGAGNQQPGGGGVLDDEPRDPESMPPDFEGECDRIPRFTQGVGNVLVGTLGVLIDDTGADSYRGAYGEFAAPGQVPGIDGHLAGSIGFGANAATGIFADLGTGFDTYTTVDYPFGAPPRGNDKVLLPRSKATGRGGVGLFLDR